MIETELHRRRILEAIGAGSVAALAGCSGSGDESTAEAEETDEEEEDDQEDDAPAAKEENEETNPSVTHVVELTVLNTDREPIEGVYVKMVGPPTVTSDWTDEDGTTEVEAENMERYEPRVYDEDGNFLSVSEIETDPEEADGGLIIHVRDPHRL